MEAGGAEADQICSLCSFGEHGQTVRGIDLNPIAYDQGRYLTSRRPQKLISAAPNRIGGAKNLSLKWHWYSLIREPK